MLRSGIVGVATLMVRKVDAFGCSLFDPESLYGACIQPMCETNLASHQRRPKHDAGQDHQPASTPGRTSSTITELHLRPEHPGLVFSEQSRSSRSGIRQRRADHYHRAELGRRAVHLHAGMCISMSGCASPSRVSTPSYTSGLSISLTAELARRASMPG
ncbi:hypothetical protein Dimus_031137 [Dionaea muscipula]